MSLSSFLLGVSSVKGKEKAIDTGLDNLFRSTAVAPVVANNPSEKSTTKTPEKDKKRKHQETEIEPAAASSSKAKRPKSEKKVESDSTSKKSTKSKSRKEKTRSDEPTSEQLESSSPQQQHKSSSQARDSEPEPSDDDEDPSQLVHESLANGGQRKGRGRHAQHKFVPTNETSEQRDLRTIFVGNVAIEVVKSKSLTKQLKRHILSFVPEAKIESVRFRSVAFQKPTAPLTTGEDDDNATDKSKSAPKAKDSRQHDRDRAASWRANKSNGDSDDEFAPNAEKTFLTPAEKKRVAYIKHEFHSSVDSVNAYIVFAHPIPEAASSRPSNLPPPKPVMNPYEAVQVAVQKADGSTFLDRTIRVDIVGKSGKKQGEMSGDPKKTVFGLVVAERGPPSAADEDQSEDEEEDEEGEEKKTEGVKMPKTWVKRVRIIRDKDTQLGKGFAYVQFVDRDCVDEILSLEQDRLKFAKRKLRVQRCKTLPGGTKVKLSTPAKPLPSTGPTRPKAPRPSISSLIIVPKGDPSLGQKISHLSKEDRKQVKLSDADRVARRLMKKKAKALAEKGVKARDDLKERNRKRTKEKKVGGGHGGEKAKKRVRSNKALVKMNIKK
ncbi:unnamed protein product [Somion occarium]|uniref:RRM domain-containing protein n=1 Tax=Somion occarium TaxID=3059160 RepID=A0ABP1DZY6_9APHY